MGVHQRKCVGGWGGGGGTSVSYAQVGGWGWGVWLRGGGLGGVVCLIEFQVGG